jgi:hypothetical protein
MSTVTVPLTETQLETLREKIEDSFRSATAHQERLRRAERRYGTTQTTLTGLSGLISGLAAAIGHPLAGDWRVVCAAAAVVAFGATATTATQKGRSDPDLLAEVSECVGKLRTLRVEALDPESKPDVLNETYRQILIEYERVDC